MPSVCPISTPAGRVPRSARLSHTCAAATNLLWTRQCTPKHLMVSGSLGKLVHAWIPSKLQQLYSEALSVCSTEAQEVCASLSDQRGVIIKHSALTLRRVSSEPEAIRLELSSMKATALTSSSWPFILRVVCKAHPCSAQALQAAEVTVQAAMHEGHRTSPLPLQSSLARLLSTVCSGQRKLCEQGAPTNRSAHLLAVHVVE